MCGIAGVIGGDARRVRSMLERLRHRGPDATADAAGATSHLGCTRLAIRGGNAGAQPLRTKRGLLVFNGEVYNLGELVKELDGYGVEVDGSSDTEVVGGLLDVHGIKGVDKLNGMYALAWDDGETLWLARDPVGIKPLHYIAGAGARAGAAFASEIAPLLGGAGGARLHAPAMSRWLTFHHAYGTETFFLGVHRVPPGGIVALPEGRVVRSHDGSLAFGKPNQALNASLVRKILERAVRDTVPDEPYGIALSGGLDSSIVAALAGKGDATAFHGRVRADGCDESRFARDVIDRNGGIRWVEVDVTAEACLEVFQSVVSRLEEPVAGPGSLAQYVVAQRAAQDVRILLSGCGGDELFSGYARNAALVHDAPPDGMEAYTPLFERLRGLDAAERAFAGLDRRAPQLFQADFLKAHPAPREEFLEAFRTGGLDPLAAAARAEAAITLPALLHVEDSVAMTFSLESRVPLLDRRILRTASRLAPEHRVAGGRLKAVLREAAEPFLPKSVAQRRDKMGFTLPLGEWFTGPWAGFAREVLLDSRTRERGMLDVSGMEAALTRPGRYDRGLYAALLLELWCRTFLDE